MKKGERRQPARSPIRPVRKAYFFTIVPRAVGGVAVQLIVAIAADRRTGERRHAVLLAVMVVLTTRIGPPA